MNTAMLLAFCYFFSQKKGIPFLLLKEIKEKNPYPKNDILDLSSNISNLCKKKYKTFKGKYIEIKDLPFIFLKTEEVKVMSRG